MNINMNLQEHIRKILSEPVNESTFFRRRVDMSTIDKKFFTNLNIVTDKYLRKHNNGQYCSFNVFRTTVISYLIDDYRDNLSDEDYDNFPYDEVYNFLLNHFYDKIKDRYVEVFGGDIQESIRKVLKEELNESTYLRRRADMSTIDKKFLTNLNIVTDKYLRKHNNGQYCSFNVFRTTVISYLIDDYRDNLSDEDYDNFPYDEVYDFLLKHFYNKIKDRYVEVFGGEIQESIRKVLKEEYKIPLNVRRRLHILRNILGSSLRSSYPCDYDDLDEFIEDTISDVNQYFKWIEKKKEMTSEEAELTIRGYLLDDIKEYYLEEIQNC